MRLFYGFLTAALIATLTATLPAAASCSTATELCGSVSSTSILKFEHDGETGTTVAFEANHTVSDSFTGGGHNNEDEWVAQMTVETSAGPLTCSGPVDRARSSESPTQDTVHIVVEFTLGGTPCGHADLTFTVGTDALDVSASADRLRANAGLIVLDAIFAGSAEVVRPATVSGMIDSPITQIPPLVGDAAKYFAKGATHAYSHI